MLFLILLTIAASCLLSTVKAQGDTTLWTSWIPLAVRSPYMSTWMDATNIAFNADDVDGVHRAPSVWPQFLQGGINGWSGLIRIDQTHTFMWLGDPAEPTGFNRTILTNIEITPSRTILNMTAGPLDLSVTFLSPIELGNPVLQSLPFSYVSLEATSNDGLQHDVQIYSDISGEWLSGDRTNSMTWTTQATNVLVYHQTNLQNPLSLAENAGQTQDGTVFYAMQAMSSQTFMVDLDSNCRGQFKQNGTLTNQIISPPHAISNPFPVFAISVDLGSISSTSQPVVWSIGMTRNPVIAYTGANGSPQLRNPYWASQFNTAIDAVTSFVNGYEDTLTRAINLDQQILNAAANVSAHYADLISLAARQVMGGTELTISPSTSNPKEWNTSDVKMFMKNLGTDGRVNPVEGLYEAFPFFLYANATYGGWLLEPVLEFANTSQWTFPYAPKDIGSNYPNATGNTSPHSQGVEQSGNMLIMTLAHARATGDGSLISRYYDLLKQWADYLVSNAFPLSASQQSADTTDTKANLTNLALKGIIGIKAMAEMSSAINLTSDAQHYSSSASSLGAQWQSQAVSSDGQHILTSFGDPDSSEALAYNLFADKLLQTNLVSSNLYSSQTSVLKSLVSQSSGGLPIDASLSQQANSVWSLFAAAYATDPSVRNSIVDQLWNRVSSNSTNTGIFSTSYKLDKTGAPISNAASPFIGGVFAPLSLSGQNLTLNISGSPSPSPSSTPGGTPSSTPGDASATTPKKSSNAGAIAGGVIGGVGGAALFGLIGFMYWRRRHNRSVSPETGNVDLITEPAPFTYRPTPNPSAMTESSVRRFEMVTAAKSREATSNTESSSQPTPSASAYTSTSAVTSSGHPATTEPTMSPTSSDAALSHSDVQGLRTEVANLRRVMESLQETRYEPPPEYVPEMES